MGKWCAVDAEGDAGSRGLLGIAVYSDIAAGWIEEKSEMIRVLLFHAREGYTFLCHNASYDIPVVWQQLGLKPHLTYYNGRLHHGAWKYDAKRVASQIWDTLDLSGGLALESLGTAIGYPKYPTPQRLLGHDPDRYGWRCERHDTGECLECYAVRDAEIVWQFMDGLETLLAGWSVTPSARIAGIALDTWRSLDHPDPIGIQDRRSRLLARAAYSGGRVETFKLGHISPCYTADVTSMYPSVMAGTDYPDPATMIYLTDPPAGAVPWDHEGCAQVDISVPGSYVPPLPYIHKGERTYPVGRLVGCWTLLELRYAISQGCRVNRVYQLAYSTQTLRPFAQYIGVLWALREAYKDAGDPRTLFAKLLMNNLYGRLGTRATTERRILKEMPAGWDSRKHRGWNVLESGGVPWIMRTDDLRFGGEWSNVLWAAQTTAAARVKLHQLMLLQGDGLLYCDTDSIFSTRPIQGTAEGLGGLSPDGQYQAALIAQPKLYALQSLEGEWRAKAKGVSRNAALRFLHGEDVTMSKPVKPIEALKSGRKAGEWIDVTKGRHPRPYRRQPINPELLLTEYGWSDTVPPVNGPIF